ncbi:MAG: enoyl-CoA hydratase/isomerase family protein [Sphingomonadales bacterium]|nr:enoyl-CoA hydratase/isomerase family protein [Sphingomonadales bacterium]
MTDAPVLVGRDGAVATVTLSRPGRRNAVTLPMCVDLHAALRTIAAGDARVVILRGAGDDFSVGADLEQAADADGTSPGIEELGDIFDAATLLHAMPQVTIAAVDGGCAGAAMGWAMACDFRFATAEARFNTAFLNVGLAGEMGLAWTLTRLVGPARARELLLFPARQTGEQALAMGLVTRLYPRADLHEAARAAAAELCARDPVTLKLMKANLVSAEQDDLARYIAVESARQLTLITRPGLRERLAAGLPPKS